MTGLLMVTTVAATIEAFLLPFARHFREKGWRVDAAARGAENSPLCGKNFDHLYEMEWTRSPLDIGGLVKALRKIRLIAEENEYDIVHVHTPIAAFLTRFALRKRKMGGPGLVYTAHGFHFYKGAPAFKNFIFRSAEKAAARWTDHLIVMNGEDYQAALKLLPREKITRVPGGVGMEREKYCGVSFGGEEIAAARRQMGDTGGDSLILMIAEFSPGKRHKDIIEALALTKDPSIRLAFAGEGPRLEEIRELAASKGLADRVSFLGFREDIPLLISAADATALPSEREGLPRSVMESMALGTPVIGADVRGVRDMLADGRGTLVPLGDVVKLAEALKKHKTATPETEAIIKKAKERAENYDVQKIIKLHEEIYDEVTGRLINRTKN